MVVMDLARFRFRIDTMNAKVAWIISVRNMPCVVFAETRDKAKWQAVSSYWDAFGKNGWPSLTAHRAKTYDSSPLRNDERKQTFSEEYVMDTMP
jgi:hypothetical protein